MLLVIVYTVLEGAASDFYGSIAFMAAIFLVKLTSTKLQCVPEISEPARSVGRNSLETGVTGEVAITYERERYFETSVTAHSFSTASYLLIGDIEFRSRPI